MGHLYKDWLDLMQFITWLYTNRQVISKCIKSTQRAVAQNPSTLDIYSFSIAYKFFLFHDQVSFQKYFKLFSDNISFVLLDFVYLFYITGIHS